MPNAPLDLSFESWHVALPPRRGHATSSSRGGPVKSFAQHLNQAGRPTKAKPVNAEAVKEPAARSEPRAVTEAKPSIADSRTPSQIAIELATRPSRSVASVKDDTTSAALEIPAERTSPTRYGPERLRADYQPPADPAIVARQHDMLPHRHGGPDARTHADMELERGFAGNIRRQLEALQAREGISRRGIGELPVERAAASQPAVGTYARLHDLEGAALVTELDKVGRELMQKHPIGTPVSALRESYGELVQFVSERTGIAPDRIYRVMDLESYGGQYWAEHESGACGLVQVRPIALEELQRLRPEEFGGVTFEDIRQNPALNLYSGMSYAQLKNEDWDHYSGGAPGYADYVVHGGDRT